MGARISVVVIALNEEERVSGTVRSAREGGPAVEVLLVDGGSGDGTRRAAEGAGARVVPSPPGRGIQLDHGARHASGDWLVFLHADTRLEAGWSAELGRQPEGVAGGAFRFAIDSPRPCFRLIEAGVALRCRVFRLPFGDQGIFARRAAYAAAGGFPPFPLMEDVAFVRRLAREGRLAFPRARAFTSARRWERAGVVATTLRNWLLLGLYAAGRPPGRLARMYETRPSFPSG